MKSFVEIRFPTDIAYGTSGGPEYSTDIVATNSGHEYRNINWQIARNRYNLAHAIKNKAQLDELISFFRARKGKAIGFRFKDWADYQASSQMIAKGDGITSKFQLIKHYPSGEEKETRIINKPVENSVVIYLDNVSQQEGFTINYTTGVISFDAPPKEKVAISADFEFDVPVRFDNDRLNATIENYSSYSWHDINLIEIRI